MTLMVWLSCKTTTHSINFSVKSICCDIALEHVLASQWNCLRKIRKRKLSVTYRIPAAPGDIVFEHVQTAWAQIRLCIHSSLISQPRWLSWMRRPTGDQGVTGSTPTEVGNIHSWRLIVKYFLLSSIFHWFKKGNCQFLVKKMSTILVNRLED